MNPAVRVVNAFWLLLRYDAVPAFETQLEISSAVGGAPFTLQTASTFPSRSVTAMTALGEMTTAREVAWLMTVCTSRAVSCALAATGQSKKPTSRDSGRRDLTGVRFILELRGFGYENPSVFPV